MSRITKLVEKIDAFLAAGGKMDTLILGDLPEEAPDEERVLAAFAILKVESNRSNSELCLELFHAFTTRAEIAAQDAAESAARAAQCDREARTAKLIWTEDWLPDDPDEDDA
jgi:hypothetical protein